MLEYSSYQVVGNEQLLRQFFMYRLLVVRLNLLLKTRWLGIWAVYAAKKELLK